MAINRERMIVKNNYYDNVDGDLDEHSIEFAIDFFQKKLIQYKNSEFPPKLVLTEKEYGSDGYHLNIETYRLENDKEYNKRIENAERWAKESEDREYRQYIISKKKFEEK